jgi:hypothetical protein
LGALTINKKPRKSLTTIFKNGSGPALHRGVGGRSDGCMMGSGDEGGGQGVFSGGYAQLVETIGE